MTTASLMSGNGVIGWIVKGGMPRMLKAIVSEPGLALASRIACLREPGPLSLVLVTANVAAAASGGAAASIAKRQNAPGIPAV